MDFDQLPLYQYQTISTGWKDEYRVRVRLYNRKDENHEHIYLSQHIWDTLDDGYQDAAREAVLKMTYYYHRDLKGSPFSYQPYELAIAKRGYPPEMGRIEDPRVTHLMEWAIAADHGYQLVRDEMSSLCRRLRIMGDQLRSATTRPTIGTSTTPRVVPLAATEVPPLPHSPQPVGPEEEGPLIEDDTEKTQDYPEDPEEEDPEEEPMIEDHPAPLPALVPRSEPQLRHQGKAHVRITARKSTGGRGIPTVGLLQFASGQCRCHSASTVESAQGSRSTSLRRNCGGWLCDH